MAKAKGPTLVCAPRALAKSKLVDAARRAREVNPANHAPVERLLGTMRGFIATPARIAVLTAKYWHTNGVRLTVGFLDGAETALRKRILGHMNAWAKTANVEFVLSGTDPDVRISRMGGADGGYWSYVGTDILSIPAGRPTMNLEGFTMSTPDSEFHRVVRHETGHTLGCPHEHMRRALVKRIDPRKAVAYFRRTQGWSEAETRAQVLTPLEESSLWGTPDPDPNSIMCYQIPGLITKSGKPILGGTNIDASDYAFLARVYPKPGTRKGRAGTHRVRGGRSSGRRRRASRRR